MSFVEALYLLPLKTSFGVFVVFVLGVIAISSAYLIYSFVKSFFRGN